ncbi:nitrite reductase small subunit NirD [Insolitispirillum peregrinum]
MTIAMTWINVGTIDAIPQQGSRTLMLGDTPIALFRTIHDEVFALVDRCPHKHGPLSQGIIHGRRVTCPLHSWVIDLASGEAQGPDEGCAGHIPLRLDGEQIFIGYTPSAGGCTHD